MDHSLHSSSMNHEMPGHEMPEMCSMNMLFTWDWKNTCVVYKWWHVKTTLGFVGTLLALVVLSMLFEYCRAWSGEWHRRQRPVSPTANITRSKSLRVKSAIMYAGLVGYSFLLMLVFMTYVGWYMIAVVVGAGIGNYLWTADSPETKALICH